MRPATRQRLRLSGGTELSFITAGEASKPAVLLLHGFPSSARYFREVVPELSQAAYVIAPDLPGFGESDVLPAASFPAFGQAISELLDRLAIGPRYIYLHDFGAPVGFHIAMQAPEQVLGLIVQNANAHRTGFGPQWAPMLAYWSQPNPENEAAATAHLTFEGMRDEYLARCPAGRGRADPGRKLGGGLAGDALAGPDGHAASAHRGLWELRRPVRRNRRISRALAAAFPDALGTARRLLRSRRDPVMDARRCRGWKPTFSTPATCCSRRTRPRPRRSCSTSSGVPDRVTDLRVSANVRGVHRCASTPRPS